MSHWVSHWVPWLFPWNDRCWFSLLSPPGKRPRKKNPPSYGMLSVSNAICSPGPHSKVLTKLWEPDIDEVKKYWKSCEFHHYIRVYIIESIKGTWNYSGVLFTNVWCTIKLFLILDPDIIDVVLHNSYHIVFPVENFLCWFSACMSCTVWSFGRTYF